MSAMRIRTFWGVALVVVAAAAMSLNGQGLPVTFERLLNSDKEPGNCPGSSVEPHARVRTKSNIMRPTPAQRPVLGRASTLERYMLSSFWPTAGSDRVEEPALENRADGSTPPNILAVGSVAAGRLARRLLPANQGPNRGRGGNSSSVEVRLVIPLDLLGPVDVVDHDPCRLPQPLR